MKSFFTRIYGKFSAEYAGRYIGTIMEEVAKSNPAIVIKALGAESKGTRLVTEWQFKGNNGKKRLADLAVMDKNNNIVMLIEIKYKDHRNLKNHAQFVDYLDYVNKKEIKFLCLSVFHLSPEDQKLLGSKDEKRFLLFSDYVNKLINLSGKKRDPAVNLLIDFFEEEGLVMQKIDEKLLEKLLIRLFKPDRGGKHGGRHGKIQKNSDMIQGIPDTLSALMQNLEIISADIQNLMGSSRAATIDFMLCPEYRISQQFLADYAEEDKKSYILEIDENNQKRKTGGKLSIGALNKGSWKKGGWAHIEYGVEISVSMASTEIETELYATVYGKGLDGYKTYKSKGISTTTLSNKDRCCKNFCSLINKAINKALDEPLPNSEVRDKLKDIEKKTSA